MGLFTDYILRSRAHKKRGIASHQYSCSLTTILSQGKWCYWAYLLIGFKAAEMVLWLSYLVDYCIAVLPVVSRKFLSEMHSFINMWKMRYCKRDSCCLVIRCAVTYCNRSRSKDILQPFGFAFLLLFSWGESKHNPSVERKRYRWTKVVGETWWDSWQWQQKTRRSWMQKPVSFKYWFSCIFFFWCLGIPLLDNVYR